MKISFEFRAPTVLLYEWYYFRLTNGTEEQINLSNIYYCVHLTSIQFALEKIWSRVRYLLSNSRGQKKQYCLFCTLEFEHCNLINMESFLPQNNHVPFTRQQLNKTGPVNRLNKFLRASTVGELSGLTTGKTTYQQIFNN